MLIQMISPNLGLPKYDDSNYSEIRTEYLARYIRNKQTGEPLYGEIHMFKKICEDCHKSLLPWFCFHGLSFDSVIKNQSRKMVEIDFLLLCPKGAIVVEVKGGNVEIRSGQYVLTKGEKQRTLEESPFEQANNAQFFLLHSSQLLSPLSGQSIFITSCCAFPHANINRTSSDSMVDLSWKLWSKPREDNKEDFAVFCTDVIEQSKRIQLRSYSDISQEQLQVIANRIAPTLMFAKAVDDEVRWLDVIEWLKINNEDTLRSLRKNDRIIIEGGPGTGKTTIAKEFIALNKEKRGLYLCWNKLLRSSIEHKLMRKGLLNCRVEQYFSFLKSLDPNGELIDFENYDKMSHTDLCFNIACLIDNLKDNSKFSFYDYVIIDEAQDILDKGASELVADLTSLDGKIENSKFLLFYDCDQEYDVVYRKPQQYIQNIAKFSAQFILTENRRVSSTKQIVAFAQKILNGMLLQDAYDMASVSDYIYMERFSEHKLIIKRINALKNDISLKSRNDVVVLLDSNCKWTDTQNSETLYQRIIGLESVTEIDVNTIKNLHELKNVPVCTILQYKGLESKHVILVVGEKDYQNKAYELYVGISRAIIKLEIWLYGGC